MVKNEVCNLKIFYLIRFILGYFHDFNASKPVRWLLISICFVRIFLSFIVFIYKSNMTTAFTVMSLLMIEHTFYKLMSLKYGTGYLQQYYSKLKLVDDPSHANRYKQIEKYLIILGVIMMLSKFSYCYIIPGDSQLFAFIDSITLSTMEWMAIDFGRFPLLMVFSLLYVRIRFIRENMEEHPFSCRSQGMHHPRTYIQMYEIILDSLDKIEVPIKIQMFVYCIISVPYTLFGIKTILEEVKRGAILGLPFVLFVMEVIAGYMPLFLSAVLSDLVHEELQDIMAIAVNRRMSSKNERDHAEIEKLIQHLKSNPFEYSLWRVVPLNVRTLLTFVAFCIATIIAVLQINNVLLS